VPAPDRSVSSHCTTIHVDRVNAIVTRWRTIRQFANDRIPPFDKAEICAEKAEICAKATFGHCQVETVERGMARPCPRDLAPARTTCSRRRWSYVRRVCGPAEAMGIIVGESPIPGTLAGNLNDLERADVAYRNLGNVRARSCGSLAHENVRRARNLGNVRTQLC